MISITIQFPIQQFFNTCMFLYARRSLMRPSSNEFALILVHQRVVFHNTLFGHFGQIEIEVGVHNFHRQNACSSYCWIDVATGVPYFRSL